jgi:hypothetical protein
MHLIILNGAAIILLLISSYGQPASCSQCVDWLRHHSEEEKLLDQTSKICRLQELYLSND